MTYRITDQIKDCIEKYSFDESYIVIMAGGCWISMMHRDQKPIHLLIEGKKKRLRIWNHLVSDIDPLNFEDILSVLNDAINQSSSVNNNKHEDTDFESTQISLTEDNDICLESANTINEDEFEYTVIRMIDRFMGRMAVAKRALVKG